MKKSVLSFALIVGLLTSASTMQAQVNMSRYITLTVTNGAAIKLDLKAAAAGTPVRIVSGSNTQDITVGTSWTGFANYTADDTEMKVYGDLIGFDCQGNEANLTAIDVSHNTQLTELYCNINNLSSLDVSKNTQLTWLYCQGNQLSSLNLSNNTQLTNLRCYNNKFTTAALDNIYCALPDRTGKDNGEIYTLRYTSSVTEQAIVEATNAANATAKNWKVRKYNESDNPVITTTGTYVCPQPNMNSYITLTVAKDSEIRLNFIAAVAATPVRIVSGSNTQNITVGTSWYNGGVPSTFTVTAAASTMTIYGDLMGFACEDNGANLTALDPSHNTQLRYLSCFSNRLSSLDPSHNTLLEVLLCQGNRLSNLDVSNNTQLTELYCYDNKFTTAALDDIYCALPVRQAADDARIYPLINSSDPNHATVLATNKQNAIAKNWKVQYWQDYANIPATTGTYVCGTVHLDTYITLTVADSAEIKLNFKAAFDGTPVKIVSGSRDTTFTVDDWWATFSKEYKSDGTEMTIYGTITGFNCEYNYENLTALDVSHNADLQELQCDNNYITDLDVTKNTLLKKLSCDYNKLTSLDVSQNTLLKSLSCSNNKITDLDLSKNTELEEFGCSYNRSLSSLDLSKNTKLTHLWCYESQLTSLNIKNCKELKYLDCHHNKLQSLDVSGSKGLWHVYCHHNNFTTQTLDDLYCSLPDRTGTSYGEIVPIYSRRSEDSTIVAATNKQNAIDKNWKVRFDDKSNIPATTGTYECPELNMNRYITLTVDNGGEITLDFKAAANVTPVRIVSGSTTQDITVGTDWYNDNTQSTFTVTADGTEMKVYGDLTGFSCGENFGNLTALDASNNKSLTQLYCSENRLSSLNISKNRALDTLSCNESQLTNLDVSKNTQLTNLSCSDNNLDSLDVSKNTELTNLSCSDNKLRDLDVSKNTKLEWLYCAKNPLDSLDVSRNTRLTDLHCYSNQLSSLDVSNNRLLETLECNSNRLTDLNVLQNKRLTQLYCYSNKLSSLSIKRNTQLEKLYCWDNNFSTQALDDIYCALPNRTGKDNGEIFPLRDTSSAAEVDSVGATTAKNATDKNWKVWKYNQVGGNTDITTNGSYDCSTSIADASAEPALTLYPNPVADVLYLSATAHTIRVYNIYGIEVAHAADTDRVEVSHLPAGIYTVNADGTVAKMVKR